MAGQQSNGGSAEPDPAFNTKTFEPIFYQRPYRHYSDLHTLHSTFVWREAGHWSFRSFSQVQALLHDPRFCRNVFEITTDPARLADGAHTRHHAEQRSLLTRSVYTRRIDQLRPLIAARANALIDRFASAGAADVVASYANLLPPLVVADLLGLPADMAAQLNDWANRVVTMHVFPQYSQRCAEAASAELTAYLRDVIAQRRADPRNDLISDLVGAGSQPLQDHDAVSTVLLLLNAGVEAGTASIGNAVKAILESGLDAAELFSSDALTSATVEECLRFDAPLPVFTRWARQDVELDGGITIEKGEEIGLMLGAANRDPARFADPDTFNPFRKDGGNVSFGAGPYRCFGAPLARLQLQVALKSLFSRLPGLHLAEVAAHNDVSHFHGLKRLVLQW